MPSFSLFTSFEAGQMPLQLPPISPGLPHKRNADHMEEDESVSMEAKQPRLEEKEEHPGPVRNDSEAGVTFMHALLWNARGD